MKALKIITALSIIVLAFSYQACDKIEEPFLIARDTITDGGEPSPTDVRKILLEDYTGHKCPNCPEAADEAENLKAIYGDQLVVISIHAGFYSEPESSGEFTYDFRTSVGGTVHDYYGFFYYPAGLVNRTDFEGSTILGVAKWGAAVENSVNQPLQATISIDASYDEAERELTASIETEFMEALEGTYYLSVFIIENGIVKPQQSEDGLIADYEHNHVLRGSMNGAWGDPVGGSGTATTGQKFLNEYTLTLDSEWVAGNCEIVAFVYNDESDTRSVIQAEEAAVIGE